MVCLIKILDEIKCTKKQKVSPVKINIIINPKESKTKFDFFLHLFRRYFNNYVLLSTHALR